MVRMGISYVCEGGGWLFYWIRRLLKIEEEWTRTTLCNILSNPLPIFHVTERDFMTLPSHGVLFFYIHRYLQATQNTPSLSHHFLLRL